MLASWTCALVQLRERRAEHRFAPRVKDTIVTENYGVLQADILNEIGVKAIVAYNDPGGKGRSW